MLRRKYTWFGPIISDEGFTVAFSHRSASYTDYRGTFEFGYEDKYLSPRPYQVAGDPVHLTVEEICLIVDRVVAWIKFIGWTVYIWETTPAAHVDSLNQ